MNAFQKKTRLHTYPIRRKHYRMRAQPGSSPLTPSEKTPQSSNQPDDTVQRLFERLFEAMPDANLLVSKAGVILLANHQAETMFGYTQDEIAGQPVETLIPSEFHPRHVSHRERYHKNPRMRPMGVGFNLFARRKNGSVFPVDIMLSPIQVGNEIQTLCVVHDISVQKASQQALQNQTAQLRLLQEISSAANEAPSIQNILQYSVDRICSYLGWPVGHAYLVENETILTNTMIWNQNIDPKYKNLQKETGAVQFSAGTGTPGMALENKLPSWITNPTDRPNFLRTEVVIEAGLKTVLNLPILNKTEICAVLEFFSDRVLEPQQDLLKIYRISARKLGGCSSANEWKPNWMK